MAKFIVIRKAPSGGPRIGADRVEVIDFTPDPAEPVRDQGIAAIRQAFGEAEGTFYYAPLSAFGKIVAATTTEVTYT